MKIKIYLILVLLLISLSGCLEDNKVKAGQVQFKELNWKGQNAFDLIVNNEGDPIIVNIAIEGQDFGSLNNLKLKDSDLDWIFELKTGENILSVNYFEYNIWIGFKKQGTLVLKTTSIDGKKPVEVLRKVIDMPYINLEIKPSNSLIHKTGDYLIITNKGNLGGKFFITQRSAETINNIKREDFEIKSRSKTIGIEFSPYPTYHTQLDSGDSKNFYLKLTSGGSYELREGETGQTSLEIYYLSDAPFTEYYIPIADVTLNYINK